MAIESTAGATAAQRGLGPEVGGERAGICQPVPSSVVVAAGECLSQIVAREYRLKGLNRRQWDRVNRCVGQASGLGRSLEVFPGDRIQLPPPSEIAAAMGFHEPSTPTVKVTQGESLSAIIAREYQVSGLSRSQWDRINRYVGGKNKLPPSLQVNPGDVIQLPTAVEVAGALCQTAAPSSPQVGQPAPATDLPARQVRAPKVSESQGPVPKAPAPKVSESQGPVPKAPTKAAAEKTPPSKLATRLRKWVNGAARELARDIRGGIDVLHVTADVISSTKDPNQVTVRTQIELSSDKLGIEFDGDYGKLVPKGGYTITVDLPYRYNTAPGDHLDDVFRQERARLEAQMRGAYRAIAYNPKTHPEQLPPPGTVIRRKLLVGMGHEVSAGNTEIENAEIKNEVAREIELTHEFGENGKIRLAVKEKRRFESGGKASVPLEEFEISGRAAVRRTWERGVAVDLDVLRPGAGQSERDAKRRDRDLLSRTVRFGPSGSPQLIDLSAASQRRDAVRTRRTAKAFDTGAAAKFSYGIAGLSADKSRSRLATFESRHVEATRGEADDNTALWLRGAEAKDSRDRANLLGTLRRSDGVAGATFTTTAENSDARELAASLGKNWGTSHITLELAAELGRKITHAHTIKRTLAIAPDGKTATLTFYTLDSKKFVDTLLDFSIGLKVGESLKQATREKIAAHAEKCFSAGRWVDDLGIAKAIGDQWYDLVKEHVEKVALSAGASEEHEDWGRTVLKVSGISRNSTHDDVLADMMAGDFSGAVAAGLRVSTNAREGKSRGAKVRLDLLSIISYAMERSHGVIDEQTVWEFEGKKYRIREMTGKASKRVDGFVNDTDYQVRTYCVTSTGGDGKPLPDVPTEVVTTVVYEAKEGNVSRDKEMARLVGAAGALELQTFVPFEARRKDLGRGTISVATAIDTRGHTTLINRTPDEAQRLSEVVARAVLRLEGESPSPELAARTCDLPGVDPGDQETIAKYIEKYFWGTERSFTGGFPPAYGWDYRIDQKDMSNIRERIKDRVMNAPRLAAFDDDTPEEKERIRRVNLERRAEAQLILSMLPKDTGVEALTDDFILAAGGRSILNAALAVPEDEPSAAAEVYRKTYGRTVEQERFVRETAAWAREVASHPVVGRVRGRLARGEKPSESELAVLLEMITDLAARNSQGSVAWSHDKELRSLTRWAVLHAMAGKENVAAMVRVQAERGSFAAASSPELTPAAVERRRQTIQKRVTGEKNRLDRETHGS